MPVTYHGHQYLAADAHAHIYPEKIAEKATASVGNFYGIPMEHIGLPQILSQTGGQAGFDRFLVCSVATKVEQVRTINTFIQQACAQYPQFVGLAAWHPDITQLEAELDDIQNRGLKGIKLHPDFQEFAIDDPKMFPFYQAVQRRGLPILFHTGDNRKHFSSPLQLAHVLDKLPELTCIAAHLGGYTQWHEARQCLSGMNLYVDTSSSLGFIPKKEALESIAHFGVDHVMFGTDFPMWNIENELETFFSLGLTEKENQTILYDTFANLFRLPKSEEY